MTAENQLTGEQEQAIRRLQDWIEQKDGGAGPCVMGVVGRRGSGKTTVLAHLRNALAPTTTILPEAVDAAVLHPDLGVAAAALQALWRETAARFAARNKEVGSDLQESFKKCLDAALQQPESYRRLSQELAMTPGHYAALVSDAANSQRSLRQKFDEFVRRLIGEVGKLGLESAGTARVVLVVDDLDLVAGPRAAHTFFRSLLTDYWHADVRWLLAFDRGRLVGLLSGAVPGRDPDNECGLALLGKVVPTPQQLELRPWEFPRRLSFTPLTSVPSGSAPELSAGSETLPTLGELLEGTGLDSLRPLLPGRPRELKELYSWLANERTVELPDAAKVTAEVTAEALRRVGLAYGATDLVEDIDRRGAATLAVGFQWASSEILPETAWRGVIEGSRQDQPLWALPVPVGIRAKVEPQGFTECLVDLALAGGLLAPYGLLAKMPFALGRLRSSAVRLVLTDREVTDYFFQKPSPAALLWQDWEAASRAFPSAPGTAPGRGWFMEIGPRALWDALDDVREVVPSTLLKQLVLPLPAHRGLTPNLSGEPPAGWLPGSLRALLLLLDGLQQVPWLTVSNAPKRWGPLAFTRCAGLLTLAGYAREISEAKTEAPRVLVAAWAGDATPLLELSEDALGGCLKESIEWVEARLQAPDRPPAGGFRLLEGARSKLRAATKALLATGALTNLGKGL